ncbi:hydrogenase maturation protease [Rhodobium gokarnense]|uniref:Hydrogenase maturation protease n=1 Tax=Rhodobium gokarnense TaxID=364296 RepID=A0ABT3HII4_9HYPH|nr:hydrogenase maturation protease [Rhodobium gokarnense]
MTLRDGGTIGLGLLPDIADADALIVVDAAELHAAPGAVRVFEGAEMDAQVGRSKGSVHEIALSDVMTAAALSGSRPERRALIAIQPEILSWGTEPTGAVAAAIPDACAAIAGLVDKWTR